MAARPGHHAAFAPNWWQSLTRFARCSGATCLALAAAGALAEEPAPPHGEVRDAILMMDTGPVHVRLFVLVGGQSPAEAREATVRRILKDLDKDGDGKLSREESQSSPLFREKPRPGAERFLQSIGAQRMMSARDIETRIGVVESVSYRQDTNQSDSDSEVFRLLDADEDGVISEVETLNAVDLILAKDLDDDECVTLEEVQPTPVPDAGQPVAIAMTPSRPVSSVADVIRDTQQTLLGPELMRKYDTDRNRKLSAAELAWEPERLAACDANGDGELDVRELQTLSRSKADIELSIDVVRKGGAPMLRVLNSLEGASAEADADFVTITLPTAVVTFLARDVDPYQASMTIAMRTFNELDMDANGYLDRDESMSRERFGRGLFDQIDSDGDGKVFGEEMKGYILARGEPVAMTCQITAFDDGAGFFATLDSNGDRRISMREMRYADKSLASAERDQKPGIGQNEPRRRFRIEFERGVFNPFGMSGRPMNGVAGEVAARPRSVGPIWFQRWDRNSDGDLTWREFMGPRDVFEQLDTDRDGLVDPQEAAAAESLAASPSEPTASTVNVNTNPGHPE